MAEGLARGLAASMEVALKYYCHQVAVCPKNLSFSLVFSKIVYMVCLHDHDVMS